MRGRALLAAAVLVFPLAACRSSPPDPYAAYRQTDTEVVPGSFDWELQPVDADYRPAIGPAKAYEEVYAAGRQPDATAILGQVYNRVEHTSGPPAWIFVTPDTCFATAKGDLVSPGRTGNGCTEDNLYVQGVNATTGETLGGFSAYMPQEGWAPARAGTPPVVTATTQLGTTRLH
jgi:hypothetical protein